MKRIRNSVPSEESQKPSTFTRSLAPAKPNAPGHRHVRERIPGVGPLTRRLTSTKSYAATDAADCENATSPGAAHVITPAIRVNANTTRPMVSVFYT